MGFCILFGRLVSCSDCLPAIFWFLAGRGVYLGFGIRGILWTCTMNEWGERAEEKETRKRRPHGIPVYNYNMDKRRVLINALQHRCLHLGRNLGHISSLRADSGAPCT
jgi:hypothetical protein